MTGSFLAYVSVEKMPFEHDKLFTYKVDESFINQAFRGVSCLVPFGKGNTLKRAIILRVERSIEDSSELKNIIKILDEVPILSDEQIKTSLNIADYYFCALYDALRLFLPPYKGKEENIIYIETLECDESKLSTRQKLVFDNIKKLSDLSKMNVIKECKTTAKLLSDLENLGAIKQVKKRRFRQTLSTKKFYSDDIILTFEQQIVFDNICSRMLCIFNRVKSYKPDLHEAMLFGVTGSGKSAVFVRLIDFCIKCNKKAMLLVPEIALTSQTFSRYKNRYGDAVSILHSRLSDGERFDEYTKINDGIAKVVIGTRSAVFAPIKDLGLVIIDEEHSDSYRSEQQPKIDARKVALKRAMYQNALVLLSSATPRLNIYHKLRAKNAVFYLKTRYKDLSLPATKIVDMSLEELNDDNRIYSKFLLNELENCLERKEQALLLLNRRGFNTFLCCSNCKKVVCCPYCSISLSYHRYKNILCCHYCGYEQSSDVKCSFCNSEQIKFTGFGTEKAEHILKRLLPEARILRMDTDTTSKKHDFDKCVADFFDYKYDIMLGTQMIAKGLDFPKVTLSAVLLADHALNLDDFTASEQAFSMITQAIGRAGRAKKGMAIIQTFDVDNKVLSLCAQGDFDKFYQNEIIYRKALLYPPFSDVLLILFISENEDLAKAASLRFCNVIKEESQKEENSLPLRVLSPSEATPFQIKNNFRYKILIKCRNTKQLRTFLRNCIKSFRQENTFNKVKITLDIRG